MPPFASGGRESERPIVADTRDLPLKPLPELLRWWRSRRVRGVIIGGIAVSLMSRPRVTRDIDALIWLAEEKWAAFLAAGGPFGFEPRLPDALPFARQSRMLLVRHRATAIDIDITLGALPFERETLDRATKVRLAGMIVPLATPEDLIVMKAVANRERDHQDIDGLLVAYPDLDVARVRRLVAEFAATLDSPELVADIERRLKERNRRGRTKQKPG